MNATESLATRDSRGRRVISESIGCASGNLAALATAPTGATGRAGGVLASASKPASPRDRGLGELEAEARIARLRR